MRTPTSPRRPSGMAKAALVTRFTTTCSSCPAEACTSGAPRSSTCTVAFRPTEAGSQRIDEVTTSPSLTRVRRGLGRPKSARSFTIRAIRFPPTWASRRTSTISSTDRTSCSPSSGPPSRTRAVRARESSMAVARLPSVPASGLFTSWATPATSVPREASREDSASWVRSARSSVTSWDVAMPMTTAPLSSRTGRGADLDVAPVDHGLEPPLAALERLAVDGLDAGGDLRREDLRERPPHVRGRVPGEREPGAVEDQEAEVVVVEGDGSVREAPRHRPVEQLAPAGRGEERPVLLQRGDELVGHPDQLRHVDAGGDRAARRARRIEQRVCGHQQVQPGPVLEDRVQLAPLGGDAGPGGRLQRQVPFRDLLAVPEEAKAAERLPSRPGQREVGPGRHPEEMLREAVPRHLPGTPGRGR